MAQSPDQSSMPLLDPFADPEPSQVTGPGTHFRSTFAQATPEPSPPSYEEAQPTRRSTNPYRHKTSGSKHSATSSVAQHGYLTPPSSTSPNTTEFPNKAISGSGHRRTSSNLSPPSKSAQTQTRARSTSLNERYPGDKSNQPLEILRKESKRAQRPPHLSKKHHHGADTIDRLDLASDGFYHHEGPYDAASRARNSNTKTSPIGALRRSNAEALRATPRENVMDSIRRHRPLDGTGFIPPGSTDRFGETYNYQEGANLMIEGNYKRWPGVEYKDEDIKGKGEPSYSIDKALKQHKLQKNDGDRAGIEMQTRRRHRSVNHSDAPNAEELQQDIHRSRSTGASGDGSGLRKKLGSLRRRRE